MGAGLTQSWRLCGGTKPHACSVGGFVRMKYKLHIVLLSLFLFSSQVRLYGQPTESGNSKMKDWLLLQAIPSFNWTIFPSQTNFAFEWRATPLLYSFGMTKLDPPWHFFIVTPPERFAGSVELSLTGQVYPSSIGSTHFAYSGQLLGHLPLVEKGEYLGLNLGVAGYRLNDQNRVFAVAGISTLFGFIHWNTKYSWDSNIWMTSLELRFF
jgi:hypothetical protein